MKFADQPNTACTFEHRFYADINTGNPDSRVTVRYDPDDQTLRIHFGATVYLSIHHDDFDKLISARDELLPPAAPQQATFIDWESGDEITATFATCVQADMFVETCRLKQIPAWRGESLIYSQDPNNCCSDPTPHSICEV